MVANQYYDEVASKFARDIETGPRNEFRLQVMYPSVMQAIGDIRDQSALDLACGTGVYARFLRQRGAARVTGVDISAGMIDVAQSYESARPLGITYLVHDVAELPTLGAFDVAVAATLFNFADSRQMLKRMYERIRANLRPGGRLVALMQNAQFDPGATVIGQFGMHQRDHSPEDGSTVLVDLGDPPQTVTTWSWHSATHEQVAEQAGFTRLQWHPHISVAEPEHPDYAAFKKYLDNPHMVILSAEAA
ncbi:methyltransferase domain-containing protein [Paraburkholderia sp.]|uniref:class I SAM-dependent methyltransferase n=1 Tax=Paraburkholderia sp. TaxID=1926495 RepID=UPI003D6FDBD5